MQGIFIPYSCDNAANWGFGGSHILGHLDSGSGGVRNRTGHTMNTWPDNPVTATRSATRTTEYEFRESYLAATSKF